MKKIKTNFSKKTRQKILKHIVKKLKKISNCVFEKIKNV